MPAPGPLTHAFDQCYFSIHLSVTWTGNHRNVSVIFSYNPRISPAPHARTGVTRSYLIYALLVRVKLLDIYINKDGIVGALLDSSAGHDWFHDGGRFVGE